MTGQRVAIGPVASLILKALAPSAAVRLAILMIVATGMVAVQAHSGPPFPILSDQIAGAYQISVWADPDATDDRSAAGKFWVMLQTRPGGPPIPAGTQVSVAITALDRAGAAQAGRAEPVNHDTARRFVALLMDHEGPFKVSVSVDGPLGPAMVEAATEATYDLRPRPTLIAVFILPFVLVGFVWGKLLIKRRGHRRDAG
jgi:hypothetical protein